MGMEVFHTAPDGTRMLVNQDVLDIDRRIKEGDATCLWGGDPRMYLCFSYVTKRYEVWRLGEDNKPRILNSWPSNELDARVLVWLAQHDMRHHDLQAEVDAHNARVEADRMELLENLEQEMKEYAGSAVRQLYLPGSESRSRSVTVGDSKRLEGGDFRKGVRLG